MKTRGHSKLTVLFSDGRRGPAGHGAVLVVVSLLLVASPVRAVPGEGSTLHAEPAIAKADCRVAGADLPEDHRTQRVQVLAGWLEAGKARRDETCYLGPEEAVERVKAGKALLVDVRRARDFGAYRIRGSLNLPGHALKASPFLRGREIVLVDTGRSHFLLEALCRDLKGRGLDVAVLDGGLRAWRRQVGPLDGSRVAQRVLELMPADEIFRERAYGHWVGVYTAGARWDPSELERLLKRAVASKRAQIGEEPHVLIADRDGTGFDDAMKVARALELERAYYLDRGIRGYRGYVADQRVASGRGGDRGEPQSCRR